MIDVKTCLVFYLGYSFYCEIPDREWTFLMMSSRILKTVDNVQKSLYGLTVEGMIEVFSLGPCDGILRLVPTPPPPQSVSCASCLCWDLRTFFRLVLLNLTPSDLRHGA